MARIQQTFVQGSLFEEDYLLRTLGAIVHSADIALTELVANAWDAGASQVEQTVSIERKREFDFYRKYASGDNFKRTVYTSIRPILAMHCDLVTV